MKIRCILSAALGLAALSGSALATPAPIASLASDSQDTINGVAIRSDKERLSYISPRYFGIRPSYEACIEQSQGVVPKQQDCAEVEYTYQDGRLNRAYKALLASLGDLDQHAAIEAQRAWITFRDKDCSARAGRFGSDAGPTTQSNCLMEATANRAQQLEDWLGSIGRHPSR